MIFIKLNFLYNSLIFYIFSMKLSYDFIINNFQSHLIINNIYNFDKSIFIIFSSIKDIWIYLLFYEKKLLFFNFDDSMLQFFKGLHASNLIWKFEKSHYVIHVTIHDNASYHPQQSFSWWKWSINQQDTFFRSIEL